MADKIIFKTLMLKGDAGEPTDQQTQTAVNEYMQEHPEAAIDETIINSAVANWLAAHPEATTTVQDGSITESKFTNALKQKTINSYVTPEMFGAIGDGVTDDTTAIQNAVQSGKPVELINDYLCGKVTGNEIIIIGNGHKIINTDNDILFNATDSFIGENFVIENPEIFDYLNSVDPYGTIQTKYCFIENITIKNINSVGVYCEDGYINNLKVYNTEFDIFNIYDGSNNNHSFGVYFKQTGNSKSLTVVNSFFEQVIEGIYVSTNNDNYFSALEIKNNIFISVSDNNFYIDSLNNRIVSDISCNYCYHCVGFAIGGNNHHVHDNLFIGGYNGTRTKFGFGIRHGSNIFVENNSFILPSFTTSAGIGASFLLLSLVDNITMENIHIENNYFDINEQSDNLVWFRIGNNNSVDINGLHFNNNKMNIKGHKTYSLFSTNVTLNNFEFCDNTLVHDAVVMDVSIGDIICKNNTVQTSGSKNFDIDASGVFVDNKFDSATQPIRKNNAGDLYCKGNTNKQLSGVVHAFTATGLTGNNINDDIVRGSVTSVGISYGTGITHPTALNSAFMKNLFLTDDMGTPVDFTVAARSNGAISIYVAAGTYNYAIM